MKKIIIKNSVIKKLLIPLSHNLISNNSCVAWHNCTQFTVYYKCTTNVFFEFVLACLLHVAMSTLLCCSMLDPDPDATDGLYMQKTFIKTLKTVVLISVFQFKVILMHF